MSIDKSGKWWVGTEGADIAKYLQEYTADDDPIQEFRLPKCVCGSETFYLKVDGDEGVAKRTCTSCQRERYIGDSEEYWAEASTESYQCIECGSDTANVGAGFALYEDNEIRRLYLGVRCGKCGILGCIAEWKIGYSPSRHLFEEI